MQSLSVGSVVRCRNREWIILPSPDENLVCFVQNKGDNGYASNCTN